MSCDFLKLLVISFTFTSVISNFVMNALNSTDTHCGVALLQRLEIH